MRAGMDVDPGAPRRRSIERGWFAALFVEVSSLLACEELETDLGSMLEKARACKPGRLGEDVDPLSVLADSEDAVMTCSASLNMDAALLTAMRASVECPALMLVAGASTWMSSEVAVDEAAAESVNPSLLCG
jgi:hypothetical protein